MVWRGCPSPLVGPTRHSVVYLFLRGSFTVKQWDFPLLGYPRGGRVRGTLLSFHLSSLNKASVNNIAPFLQILNRKILMFIINFVILCLLLKLWLWYFLHTLLHKKTRQILNVSLLFGVLSHKFKKHDPNQYKDWLV